MIKKISFSLLFILIHLMSNAQNVTMLNAVSKQPIENVKAFNRSKEIVVYSNEKGIINLNDFKINEMIYFYHTSYLDEKKTILQIVEDDYKIEMFEGKLLPPIDIKPPRENTHEDFSTVRIEKIRRQELKFSMPQTSVDLLQLNSNITVQKSQSGGGSPIIRGFEANKILLVIDGVRLNNAIYRSGHLQNAITVDNNILENADIFYGPGSVIYGSDALGGVIHYHTKNPLLSKDSIPVFHANYMGRIGTANGENTNHVDFSYGRKKWASLTSVTFSSFKDFKMGKNRNHGYDDFGKIPSYIRQINGMDSIVENTNQNVHPRTGYNQLDLLQKFSFKINEEYSIGINLQYSTSSIINRFDKLNEYRNGELRYAEWYYGPQKRLLTALKFESKKETKFSDYYSIIGAFQKIDEDRISREYRDARKTTQEEDVYVYSLNADFLKKISDKEVLYYGLELSRNDVTSQANETNIITNTVSPAQTRYPNKANTISSFAGYATMDRKITEDVSINFGGRFSRFNNFSEIEDSSILNLPFSKVDYSTSAFSGSFSIKYEKNGFRGELIGSSGFRSPNLDDYGKVFEKNGDLVVPNDALGPEVIYNGEINLTKKWEKDGREYLIFKLAGFYTTVNDAIVRSNYQLNGQDSVLYQGQMVNLVANQNINSAKIYGGSFDVRASFTPFLSASGSINITQGTNVTEDTTLSHIPPTFGRMAFTFANKKLKIQLGSQFNFIKKINTYGPGSTDNRDEATIDGTPAWITLNLITSFKLNNQFSLQGSITNIFDTHYKQFASGVSGLGRNFTIAVRGNF